VAVRPRTDAAVLPEGQIATFSNTFVDAIAQMLVSWDDSTRRGGAVEITFACALRSSGAQ
jgi:hypothetical protein